MDEIGVLCVYVKADIIFAFSYSFYCLKVRDSPESVVISTAMDIKPDLFSFLF